jgi:hypothetical protein
VVVPLCLPRRGTRCGLSPEARRCWQGSLERGAGHLFVARSDMEWFGRNPMGSINASVSPLCGDHDS